jgi:hypothetical protein
MNFHGHIMMGTRGRTGLIGVGCTLAMLHCVVETWDEQGSDCIGCATRITTAPGSDVTSHSNENPSMTPYFLAAYLD